MSILDIVFSTKDGKKVVAQKPNLPILLAALFYSISWITTGEISSIFGWTGRLILLYWAYLEIISGVNLFRRVMGLVVVGFILVSLLTNL